tara:strand:- start:15825 stop:16328 length:504 start_codon:yes stop_codon:yes gene_type:complete
MGEKDYVTDPLKLSFSGTVPFDVLYKTMNNWVLKRYKYDMLKELEHNTVKKKEGKDLFIKWRAFRKITDYVTYTIEIELKISDMVEVKRKGSSKKWYKGKFDFLFNAYVLKDYEDRWSKHALTKFMRELSDRFLTGSKFDEYEAELLGELQKFIAEIKAFLGVQKVA